MQVSRESCTFDDLLSFEDEKIRAVKLDIKLNATMYRGDLGINRDNASDIADSYVFANVRVTLLQKRSLISSFCTINVIVIHFICAIYVYFVL